MYRFWKMAMKKTKPTFLEEYLCWDNGIEIAIGIDEVGRGAFAGPIVAAGVIYKSNIKQEFLEKVNDSKLIKPKLREVLSILIKQNSIWEIQSVGIEFINKFGIGKANNEVFCKVLDKITQKINTGSYFILVDGFKIKHPIYFKKQKAIVNGDRKSLSIASASIIAKVYRDNIMRNISNTYPSYNFEQNKGYGTLEHRNAIKSNGLCDFHRTSFDLQKFL